MCVDWLYDQEFNFKRLKRAIQNIYYKRGMDELCWAKEARHKRPQVI